MNWDAFLDQLRHWFDSRGLLTPGLRWVVGVSGGADSTLLLHAMHDLGRSDLGWHLCAAHLHHGLRGREADEDAEFVSGMAQRLGIPCEIGRVELRDQLAEQGGSTEEVARQRRYEFLERVALRCGSEHVAVAHHADDNAETVLHRICRGTGLRGLAGMPGVRAIQPGSRVRLVRPLLEQRRETLLQLCRQRGLTYRTDSTNLSTEFTRGRIRNVVLPLLRETINPGVTEALLRLAGQASWVGAYLEDAAARIFESLVVFDRPGCVALNTRALLAKPRIIQAEVVRRAVSLVVGGELDMGFPHVEAVLKLAAERSSGKELHLPGPVVVRKLYNRLEFGPLADAPRLAAFEPVVVACPGTTLLPLLGAELVTEIRETDPACIEQLRRGKHPYEEWVDFDRLRLPLVVRGRRDGDRFWPLGAPGSKSVSDFLSDEKVEPPLRARTGVVCDQAGPIWVMPLRIDERVKLRPTTRRALRMVLTVRREGLDASP